MQEKGQREAGKLFMIEQRRGANQFEKISSKENVLVREVVVDPRKLRKGNLAYKIVNLSVLNNGTFDPIWYETQHAEIVRVMDEKGNVELKAYDGHHRIEAAARYLEDPKNADYEFVANDVTALLSQDKYEGQIHDDLPYLTKAQWLKEVSDPTRIHAEHAFRRIAAILMTDWDSMAGVAAVKDVSALGGLVLLDEPQSLKKGKIQGPLREGLQEMAGLIRDTELSHPPIVHAAFEMLTPLYEDIGETEKKKQITGLLSLPKIDAKIATATTGSLEENRSELAQHLMKAFDSLRDEEEAGGAIRAIREVLTDELFGYQEMVDFLHLEPGQSKSFKKEYRIAKVQISQNIIIDTVRESISEDMLPLATTLIRGCVSAKPKYNEPIVTSVLHAVDKDTEAALLIQEGQVDPVSLSNLREAREALLTAGSRQALDRAVTSLNNTLIDCRHSKQGQHRQHEPVVLYDPVDQKGTVEGEGVEEAISTRAAELTDLLADHAGGEFPSDVLDTLSMLWLEISAVLPIESGDIAAPPEVKESPQEKPETTVVEKPVGWDAVSYTENEGTAAWFEGKEFDPAKATMMIHDAAKKVFEKDPDITAQWDALVGAVTYKKSDGTVVSGLDALQQALVQEQQGENIVEKNMLTIIKSLGLSNDSPEFTYLATSFMLHSVNFGTGDNVSAVKSLGEKMRKTITAFQQKNNNQKILRPGSEAFQRLLYANLEEDNSRAILDALNLESFSVKLVSDPLDKHRAKRGQIRELYKKMILKENK